MNNEEKKDDKEIFSKFCHDLRTPLSIMRMNLDLFVLSPEYKTSTPKVMDFVKTIEAQVTSLTEKIAETEKAHKR